MIYCLVVMSDPTRGSNARHAAAFAHSAIGRGHSIHRVFFLDSGTRCGSSTSIFPQDEVNPRDSFVSLAENHNVDLVLCVTSALRQGQLDQREANRHGLQSATIHPSFIISGLGQLIDGCAHADRVITFGE